MKQSTRILLALTAAAMATACAGDDDAFRRAVPGKDSVTITPPASNTGNALVSADDVGDPSGFYEFTREITGDVNGAVAWLVDFIDDIIAKPAWSSDGDRRIWGPGTDDNLDVMFRLVVERTGDEQYAYRLEFRPAESADEDANYTSLIDGTSDLRSGINDGAGSMSVYVEHWHELEPDACATGALHILYDTASEPQDLTVDFDGFNVCNGEGSFARKELDAVTYYYSKYADGAGNFQFAAGGDIHQGAHTPAVKEDLHIRARWDGTGAGRADVNVRGGDMMAEDGVAAVDASECWDENFNLVYSDIFPSLANITRANQGDEGRCATGMEIAQYATDL